MSSASGPTRPKLMSTAARPAAEPTPLDWKSLPWASIGLIGAFLTALYWDVIPPMVEVWMTDPGYSHGILIPPLAAYVAWLHKDEIAAIPATQDLRGVAVTVFGCLVFLIGRLGAEFFLTRVSLVIVLAGIALTFWGAERFKKLLFALFLLATMVPIPAIIYNRLAAPLQLFASSVSESVLNVIGIPVFRDGNILNLPQISLGVAEACSGLRSISSLAVLALVVGYFVLRSVPLRGFLLLLAFPTAIAVNVLRIVLTALAAQQNPEWARGFLHDFSGWAVFLLGFLILYAMSLGLAKFDSEEESDTAVA